MAQIIKHRRGSIDSLAAATAKKGELVMATGSVGNMQGPWIFVGETEGSAGAFRGLSKIYQGSNVPDLSGGSYGSTLNGTPYYATNNQTLYILSNSGNVAMDLTGNIEGNVISGVTINNLTGSPVTVTGLTDNRLVLVGANGLLEDSANLTFDGNTFNIGQGQFEVDNSTGNIRTSGSITMKGNITIGDNQGGDIIDFNGEVSSSIIPSGSNLFDLGSSTNAWRDLYVSGTAYIEHISLAGISVSNIDLPGNLVVSGTTILSGSVYVEDLTDNRVVIVGPGGLLEDDANFTFNGTSLKVGDGNFEVDQADGDIRTSGSVSIANTLTVSSTTELQGAVGINNSLDVTGSVYLKNSLEVDGESTLASATVEDLTQYRLVVAGAGGSLEDYSGLTYNGSTLTVGGTTQLNGDLTVSGNFTVLGSATEVHISSSVVELDDNIIRLNAYSPFERYAGFEVIDSGSSGVSASMVWDSQNDYWLFVSSSGQSSKFIGTTAGTYGSEVSLTTNTFPIATGANTIGDSLLTMISSGTTLAFNTNKFTVNSADGATLIAGNVTLSAAGGADAGTNSSAIIFRNSSNVLGYVSTTETTEELDGILGYKNSDGALVFSTVIDGGVY